MTMRINLSGSIPSRRIFHTYHFGGHISGLPSILTTISTERNTDSPTEFGMEVMNIQMGIRFQRGLLGFHNEPDNRISQQNIFFTLGYMF